MAGQIILTLILPRDSKSSQLRSTFHSILSHMGSGALTPKAVFANIMLYMNEAKHDDAFNGLWELNLKIPTSSEFGRPVKFR